jgi:hypothetical protein
MRFTFYTITDLLRDKHFFYRIWKQKEFSENILNYNRAISVASQVLTTFWFGNLSELEFVRL